MGGGPYRFGGVARSIFKIARAQTETQGEGGARRRRLGSATGGPSIHRANANANHHQRSRGVRVVRGQTSRRPRPRGRRHAHAHSHRLRRMWGVCETRRQAQTLRRARSSGDRAAANTENTTGSDWGGEGCAPHEVATATCPVRQTFYCHPSVVLHS